MIAKTTPDRPGGEIGVGTGWFALAGVWALTIAWPIYQNIASGPEALTDLGIRRLDLLVLIGLVSLVMPTAIALFAVLIGRLAGPVARSRVLAVAIAVIIGLFCWQQVNESFVLIRLLLPLGVTLLLTWLILQSRLVQNFAFFLGFALPVVIIAFLGSYPVWNEVRPHEKAADVAAIEVDTPVVMVIFDELPLAALENERGRIDARLFPNFADLAEHSSWYPGMTARATSTVSAVPAILTGKPPTTSFADKVPPPGLPDYPDNVCAIAKAGGYRLTGYEPITDLCHRAFGLGSRVTAAIRRGTGADQEIPTINLAPNDLAKRIANKLAAPFPQPWSEYGFDREQAIDAFIEGLPAEKRSFSLLHIALPHIFWQFMPDGTRYESNRFTGAESLTSPPSRAQVNHDMQQMMLQLAYTDRQLGRIIATMKEEGTWNDALFVATADHGAGFVPGGNRRLLDQENAGWILPVPLFIKFPGQPQGRVVSGSVDSLDIAPTVLDVLEVKPPGPLPGRSLAGRKQLPLRTSLAGHTNYGTVEMNRRKVSNLRRAAVRQRNRIFGGGELFALGGHSELIGRSVGKVAGLRPLEATPGNPEALASVNLATPDRPSYFRAAITSPGQPGRTVAVSLNRRIAATTRTWTDGYSGNEVTGVNLPDRLFVDGENRVAVYELPE